MASLQQPLPNGKSLMPHQARVVGHMLRLATQAPQEATDEDFKGLIVAHSMGSGKTLTALATAYHLARAGHVDSVQVMAPVTMQSYWGAEVDKLGLRGIDLVRPGERRSQLDVRVMKYDDVLCMVRLTAALGTMEDERAERVLLIVDEAHNFRTNIPDPDKIHPNRLRAGPVAEDASAMSVDGSSDDDEVDLPTSSMGMSTSSTDPQSSGPRVPKTLKPKPESERERDARVVGNMTRSHAFLHAAARAKLVMLLTGTPVVNGLGDLCNLVGALRGWTDVAKMKVALQDLQGKLLPQRDLMELSGKFRGCFSVFDASTHPGMPRIVEHVVLLAMPQQYLDWYDAVDENRERLTVFGKNNKPFLNGPRRAVNGNRRDSKDMWGPKMKRLREMLEGWFGPAAAPDTRVLVYTAWDTYGVKMIVDVVDGLKLSYAIVKGDRKREDRRLAIAAYNRGDAQVLIFTRAGAEGMDLQGTTHVVITEPAWNMAQVRQAMGRAARLNSHAHLAPERRVVHVHHMVLQKPPDSARPRDDQPL